MNNIHISVPKFLPLFYRMLRQTEGWLMEYNTFLLPRIKNIILLILSLFLTSCASRNKSWDFEFLGDLSISQPADIGLSPGEINKSDYLKLKLHGKVKSVHEFFYGTAIKRGEIVKQKQGIYYPYNYNKIILFNESGRITQMKLYDGSIQPITFSSIYSYKYDSNGNLLETKRTWSDTENTEQYFYDTYGSLNKVYSKTLDYIRNIHYSYDSSLHMFTELETISKATHQYDEHDNRISFKKYKSVHTDSISYEIIYRYNETV